MLRRLERIGAVEPVLEQFRDAIEEGSWAPGSQIPTETELMEMLGVGRSVVREALATLKGFGLIDSRPGRGTFVTHKPSELATWILAIGSDNQELLEARFGIDGWINYLAARKATPEDLEVLTQLMQAMETAAGDDRSLEEVVAIDGEFHAAMARATHNSVLARLTAIMDASLKISRRANISRKDLLDEAIRSHRELIEAVRRRDCDEAWTATHRSLTRVASMQGIELDLACASPIR